MKNGARDPLFAVQSFQFGRYLMIAGSRCGTQPLNLQGIWSQDIHPTWGSMADPASVGTL
ncbi:MAG: glycosyl hydrolase family 95 catalytic domain-containing protein [Planctomycetota bacterium]